MSISLLQCVGVQTIFGLISYPSIASKVGFISSFASAELQACFPLAGLQDSNFLNLADWES